MNWKWMRVGFLLVAGVFLALAPSCQCSTPTTCDASTCAGCCDREGVCRSGSTSEQCGHGGASCTSCGADQVCANFACTPQSSGDGGETDGGINVDAGADAGVDGGHVLDGDAGVAWFLDACARLKAAFCENRARCGLSSSAATCLQQMARLEESSGDTCSDFLRLHAIASGTTHVNTVEMEACIAELGASTVCERGTSALQKFDVLLNPFSLEAAHRLAPSCLKVFEGTVAPNQSCYTNEECANGGWCDKRENCPGVCAIPTSVGEDAGLDGTCIPGAVPHPDTHACILPVAEGGSCATQSVRLPCAPGLYCDGDTCVAQQPAMSRCSGNNDVCAEPLICNGNQCGTGRPVDGGCGFGFGVASYACLEDLTCLFSEGAEVCRPLGDTGAACMYDSDCLANLFCDGESIETSTMGTCAPRRTSGPCTPDGNECASTHFCNDAGDGGMACVARLPLGSACSSDRQCEPGLACTGTSSRMCTLPELCPRVF